MVIDQSTLAKITQLTDNHWAEKVTKESFLELTKGKEIGHRIADYVDDQCTALLKVNMDAAHECDKKGNIRKRSMGDIWIRSNEMWNPLNIKSGLQNMNGQPNVVSMRKILDSICNRQIDSYYLLIVKFDLKSPITHRTYLIDMLDWIDFLSYDAGPGQIMLKEKDFYAQYETNELIYKKSVLEKAELMFNLYEEKLRANLQNRKDRFEDQKRNFTSFVSGSGNFNVDQSGMEFRS